MNTSLLNSNLSRRALFSALLGTAVLIGPTFPASAQIGSYHGYQGTLSFPRNLIEQCAWLQRGDQATVTVLIFLGDAVDLSFFKHRTDLGTVGFSSVTTSGVPVTGRGTLVANYNGGTLHVTDLTVHDPLGADCTLIGLNLSVKMAAY